MAEPESEHWTWTRAWPHVLALTSALFTILLSSAPGRDSPGMLGRGSPHSLHSVPVAGLCGQPGVKDHKFEFSWSSLPAPGSWLKRGEWAVLCCHLKTFIIELIWKSKYGWNRMVAIKYQWYFECSSRNVLFFICEHYCHQITYAH